MKVYGQLEKAQIENLTVDPTGLELVPGRVWYRTDTKTLKGYDGTAVQEFADLTSAQSFSNKKLITPLLHTAQTTPSNPPAGEVKTYFKSDGNLYKLDSAGAESQFTTGAAALDSDQDMLNASISVTQSAGSLTVALRTKAGGVPSALDPVKVSFANTTGGYIVRTITSALTLTLTPGQHLGHFISTALTLTGGASLGRKLYAYIITDGTTNYLGLTARRFQQGRTISTISNVTNPLNSTDLMYTGTLASGTYFIKQLAEIGFGNVDLSTAWTSPTRINLGNVFTPNMYRNVCASFAGNTSGFVNNEWPNFSGNSIMVAPGAVQLIGNNTLSFGSTTNYQYITSAWHIGTNGGNFSSEPGGFIGGGDLFGNVGFEGRNIITSMGGLNFGNPPAPRILLHAIVNRNMFLNMQVNATTVAGGFFQAHPSGYEIDSHGPEL